LCCCADTFFWVSDFNLGFVAFAGCVWIRHKTSQKVIESQSASYEVKGLSLFEIVRFQSRLQRGNRLQVPRMAKWLFNLESYQILRANVSLLGVRGVASQNFFQDEQKDGRIVIPKQTLDLLRQDRSNIEGYMMEVSLEPS
jgi:hypothetical protein